MGGDAANLDVSVATTPSGSLKAGEEVSLTATVKNTGTGAAYRVLPRIVADDGMFTDVELPIGKVAPGETKTFTAKLKVPTDANDRVDRLGLEVHEAKNAVAHVTPGEVKIEAAPKPVFAYSWQLVDEGNGDGLVQRGEKYKLEVQIKNTGSGPTQEATVLLRNATGDGVTLDKSRIELKDTPLQPGQVKELEFPLATDGTLKADEVTLELMAYDADLDVQASDKLHFRVAPGVSPAAQHGDVTVKAPVAIHAGAADDTSVVGMRGQGRELLGDRELRPVGEGEARRRARRVRAGLGGHRRWRGQRHVRAVLELDAAADLARDEEPRDQRRHVQAERLDLRRSARRGRLRVRRELGREDRQPQGVLPLQPRRQGRQGDGLRHRAAAVARLEHGHGGRAREQRGPVDEDAVHLPGSAPDRANALKLLASWRLNRRALPGVQPVMRTTLLAGVFLLVASASAFAQDVAGTFDVKFDEAGSTCNPPPVTYTRGKLVVEENKQGITVNIETVPQMVGGHPKKGSFKATTRPRRRRPFRASMRSTRSRGASTRAA